MNAHPWAVAAERIPCPIHWVPGSGDQRVFTPVFGCRWCWSLDPTVEFLTDLAEPTWWAKKLLIPVAEGPDRARFREGLARWVLSQIVGQVTVRDARMAGGSL